MNRQEKHYFRGKQIPQDPRIFLHQFRASERAVFHQKKEQEASFYCLSRYQEAWIRSYKKRSDKFLAALKKLYIRAKVFWLHLPPSFWITAVLSYQGRPR